MKAETKQIRRREYRSGYRAGYHLGLCEAVRQMNPEAPGERRPLRLMYVPQGFDAIDAGVVAALGELTAELIVSPADRMLETAAETLPSAVLVMNGLHVFPDDHLKQIEAIRALGIRTAIWFVDDPYFTEDTAAICRHYDVVFTHELGCVDFYRSLGVERVHYMPLGVNPQMFYPRRSAPGYKYDIVFIGNAFFNRTELFDRLAPYLKSKKTFIGGGFWERLNSFNELSDCIHDGFIPPEETAHYYSSAKLVINIHRPWEGGQDNRNAYQLPSLSINPRTYEISACGTMQLTDVREDLTRYYRPGYDLETFGSAEELRDKIEYYLTHEKERRLFALRALRTTLRHHTFKARLPELLDILRS